jgi:hypothetical protein
MSSKIMASGFRAKALKGSKQLSPQGKRYKSFYGKGTKASACMVWALLLFLSVLLFIVKIIVVIINSIQCFFL